MQKRRQEQTQQLVAQQQQCRTPESNETYRACPVIPSQPHTVLTARMSRLAVSREAYMSQVARVTEALDRELMVTAKKEPC